MASEQPRDEMGQFAPVAAENRSQDQAVAAAAQTQPEPMYKVKVDGQEVEVSLDEALKGYIRHETFRQRMEGLKVERERLSGGLQPGLQVSQQGYGQGDPFHGGRVGPAGVSPWVGQEQPAYGTPATRQPPAPPDIIPGDEDYVNGKTFRSYAAALEARVRQVDEQMRYQEYERQQDAVLAAMPSRIPGFTPDEAYEAILMLPEYAQQEYRRMSRAAALEIAHYRLVAPRKAAGASQAVATGAQTGTEQKAVLTPPYGADVRGGGIGTQSPLDPRNVDGSDPAAMASFMKDATKRMGP